MQKRSETIKSIDTSQIKQAASELMFGDSKRNTHKHFITDRTVNNEGQRCRSKSAV